MTGKFRFAKKSNYFKKHDHISIVLNKDITLNYNDVRKFGYFAKISNPISLLNFKKLGREPFLLKRYTNYLWIFLKKKNVNIKSLLLDQSFIAGIGNIYASEILFDSKIYPFKIAKQISKKSFSKLLNSVEKILKNSISKGGSTIKDYKNTAGELGYFQNDFKVYGREGLTCYKCKSLILKVKSSGRSTFFCKNCQK
jgi:formamidopyrimidine-DNA glycosylase